MDGSIFLFIYITKKNGFDLDLLSSKNPQILYLARKDCTALGQEAKGMSSAASPPHFFFSVPVPHALCAQLALCSPLILH